MDDKPFLELDLEDIDENIIPELQKLTKAEFDVDTITNSAGELKYLQQIKKIIGTQFAEPDDENSLSGGVRISVFKAGLRFTRKVERIDPHKG